MNAPFKPEVEADPDIAWQRLRNECEAEFEDWQRADYDNREFTDFGNWIVNKARWNAPNRYGEALRWDERMSDEQFKHINSGLKNYSRKENRNG
jgi:hypothetical protein